MTSVPLVAVAGGVSTLGQGIYSSQPGRECTQPYGELGRQKRALEQGFYLEITLPHAQSCQGDAKGRRVRVTPCPGCATQAWGHGSRAWSFPSAQPAHCSRRLGKPFSPGMQFPSSSERPCAISWPLLKLRETQLNRSVFHTWV